jgi:tripartite-type tricarboxylate transporter receptor subunit TctC
MLHVPYKGSNPALMDVVGGKITFMFDMPITIVPHIQAGKIKPLAVTSKQRLSSMPNVPTMIEAGIADYEVIGWFGLMGPKGLPADITNKLKAAIDTVTQNKEFRETIEKAGYAIVVEDGKTLNERVVRELAVWEKVVTDAKIN